MALIIFESQVNMLTVATPSIGGYVVAYDLDGKLKQKDSNGIITLVGATGYAAPLGDILALSSSTGTYSILLGNNTAIASTVGTASIKLDNNFIRLSTDGDSYQESYLTINSTQVNLSAKGGSSSIILSDSVEIAYKNTDKVYLANDLFYVTLNNDRIINFTTSTASQPAGSKISGVISSEQSYFSTVTNNSLILGGIDIIGTQSNSIYVANILSKGPIKGIDGTAKLEFNQYNEAFLTSNNYIIGFVSSSASLAPNNNGIIMVDNLNSYTTPAINSGVVYISSVNSSNTSGIVNSVVIGGFGLSATESNTVYLGSNVNINNIYKLPTTDGLANQVIITDGAGNLSWSSSVSNQVVSITASIFTSLSSYSANTTYRIIDADSSLYGGTEIYLSTNANGVLNDKGVGKFFNPKYNQGLTGYGIWNASASYATFSAAIWGGYLWQNINGTNINTEIDQFTLDPTEWNLIPYNTINYNVSYDEVKYDVVNDRITYRNERNTNIVDTSYDKILTASYSAIKSFQWGNLYNTLTQIGVSSVKLDGTFINLINATGSNFTNKKYFGDAVYIGTASVSATTDRFVVSNSGTASLVVDTNGNVYNRSKGTQNTLFGFNSLLSNISGTNNSVFGNYSLYSNTVGLVNNAFGYNSLYFNTTGTDNIAIGTEALYNNTIGIANISIGNSSLYNNISGDDNISIGHSSLEENISGTENVVLGNLSLVGNLSGNSNTVIGFNSFTKNEIGDYNIVIGYQSGPENILATNSNSCIYIGNAAGNLSISNTNEIIIGSSASGNGSNTITLGNDSITKTILKGNIGIGVTATPATVNIEGTLNYVVDTSTYWILNYNGEVVYYGNSPTGLTAGYIYALEKNTGNWLEADNINYYDCHLAIALGATVSSGMLVKGFIATDLVWYNMITGNTQFLGSQSGQFQGATPSTVGEKVRVIGYPVGDVLGTNMLYFNPDNMWLAQSIYNTI
jgi:hypothetical protein